MHLRPTFLRSASALAAADDSRQRHPTGAARDAPAGHSPTSDAPGAPADAPGRIDDHSGAA
jgi:hypothetical protein